MRIQVTSDEHNIRLWLPTTLLFSAVTAEIAVYSMRKYVKDQRINLSSAQMRALFAEFRRVKTKYGRWELVDVRSSDGDIVKIIL